MDPGEGHKPYLGTEYHKYLRMGCFNVFLFEKLSKHIAITTNNQEHLINCILTPYISQDSSENVKI